MRGDKGTVASAASQIKRQCRRIRKSLDEIYQFHRLKKHEHDEEPYHLVACTYERNDYQTTDCIYEEDVSVIEEQVEETQKHQQDHSPDESGSEVNAFLCLIVMLDKEAQSEQYREYRIHLSCEQKEDGIPDSGIDCSPEVTLGLREHEEIHLFLEMYEDDAGYGDTSQDVRYIDSCIGLPGWKISIVHVY